MTFLIAAAGTGGHVYPGLAVGAALVEEGVSPADVLYVGGDRLESKIYPEEGFPFLEIDIRGLKRSLSLSNVTLPGVMRRAADKIAAEVASRQVGVALGMGGYVTIPTAMAARRSGIVMMVAEQNAGAGLANRMAGRNAVRQFVSFPATRGLSRGEWVGNPVRRPIRTFDRGRLRAPALEKYELDPAVPVLGAFGGSLGAGVINDAVAAVAENWVGDPAQILHLTGTRDHDSMQARDAGSVVAWRRVAFETQMEDFYAVCDLVVARSGGSVAELTATGTPAILVPGSFGSAGHQAANARFLEQAGAAVVLTEDSLSELGGVAVGLLGDTGRLEAMSTAAALVAKPDAAITIARAMMEAA